MKRNRRLMRRGQRTHCGLIVVLLFALAAYPLILFAALHRHEEMFHNNVPNKVFDSSRSLMTSSMSATTDSPFEPHKFRTRIKTDRGAIDQSCYTIYISKDDVSAASESIDGVVNRFLLKGKVPKGSSIILVTDDESVLNQVLRKPKGEYQWTVLHENPSFINFLATLTDLKRAAKCHTVVSSSSKEHRFLYLLFGVLKADGRPFQSVLVNMAGTKTQLPTSAIFQMKKVNNTSLRTQKKSEIGLQLCQFFSGNLCHRWFH